MYIKVWDDKYVIKSDSYCYRVNEIKQKLSTEDNTDAVEQTKDGDYEVTVGYVKNVAQCFRLIVEREGRQNKCTTLNGYIKHLEEINKKLEENLKKFAVLVGGPEMVEQAMLKISGKLGEE